MLATKIKGCARCGLNPTSRRHELTTTMHHLSLCPEGDVLSLGIVRGCQDLVRFFALLRIKPHAPPLVRAPVNSFEFQSCDRTSGGVLNALAAALGRKPLTPSTHRLRRGLPGYLILFAPHAFAPQRQLPDQRVAFATGVPPHLYAFHRYVEFHSPLLHSSSPVSMTLRLSRAFTSDLRNRLRALCAQ